MSDILNAIKDEWIINKKKLAQVYIYFFLKQRIFLKFKLYSNFLKA